jgi:hypothetical protein
MAMVQRIDREGKLRIGNSRERVVGMSLRSFYYL